MKHCLGSILLLAAAMSLAGMGASVAADHATESGAQSVVAVVGGEKVTLDQLQKRTRDASNEQQRAYERQQRQLRMEYERARAQLLESTLNQQIDDRVLELEAAARHSTRLAVLGDVKTPEVSATEVQAFYDSQKGQINQPLAAVAGQIRMMLLNQAADRATRQYLDQLRAKYQATVLLEPLRAAVAPEGASRGAEGAPVTIVEFADFQCPYCARMVPVMQQVLASYPKQVRVVYRNLPLSGIHPDAAKAAEAGACARAQGKFWEMHDAMFADQASLNPDALKGKAVRVGLDAAEFANCLDSGKAAADVARDVQAAEDQGIAGVPAFFVNGRYLNGAMAYDEIAAVIDDELRRRQRLATLR
jgi:protein-disulfide isomerase